MWQNIQHSTSSTFVPSEPVNDMGATFALSSLFIRKDSLTRHTYRQHGGGGARTNRVKVKCEVCKNDFLNASNMRRHMKNIH